MLRWIEKTRKKPKAVRDQYAFVGALSVTALIALIWFVSVPTHFANMEVEGEAEKEAVGAFAGFLSDAKANIAAVFSAIPQEDEQAATSTSATSSAAMPTLRQDNVNSLRQRQEEEQRPAPRTVLIATTSHATASSASTTAED